MNKLTEKSTHTLHFRAFRTLEGYVQPGSIRITQKRYESIREAMSQKGIVEIDGSVYHSSDIRCMEAIPNLKPKEPQPWDSGFEKYEDYEKAHKEWKERNGK